MKQNFLFAICMGLSVLGWGQSAVGIQIGFSDCGLQGAGTTLKPRRSGLAGQLWGEWRVTDVFGLKAAVGYAERGGSVEGTGFETEVLTFHLMPRIHVADAGSRSHLRLMMGAGLYTNLLHLDAKPDFVKSGDFGVDAEVGFEWNYFAVLLRINSSIIDVTNAPKNQRWMGAGVSVQVPIWKGQHS